MENFRAFVHANKHKIYAAAEKNTKRNSHGDAVLSRDDSWLLEDWEEPAMSLIASKPLTPEQIQAREQKKIAKAEEQRKLEQDLINAYILEQLALKEDKQND